MTIKQFLTQHVEGYLFKDLRTMMRVELRKGQKVGGVGYPVVASILAGMEMLGGLLQARRFRSRGASTTYFNNYWDNFFVKAHPKYANYRDAFWQLIRNGITHTYLTKTGIWIFRGNTSDHLKVFKNGTNYYLAVDIKEFFNDFVSSYTTQVRPIVWGGMRTATVSKTDIEQRLREMISAYERESNSVLSRIPTPGGAPPSPPPIFWTLISGPSISPAGTIVTISGTRFGP